MSVPSPVSALMRCKDVTVLSGVLGLHIHIKNMALIYLVVVTMNIAVIVEVVSGWAKQE